MGKSSNRFSLLLLRWPGSTSRMCYAIPLNMACSRPTRSDAVFSIGTTEILQLTITEKLWRNAWTRQMEQNEHFLEPVIKKAVCVCFVLSFPIPGYGHMGAVYQEERIQEAFLILSSAHHRSSPSTRPESRPPQNGTPRKRHSYSHRYP